jgi:hypothetical protein
MRILPGVLKELSKHVPAVLFQTVEWRELAEEIPKISRRLLQKEGYDELLQQQRDLLSSYGIDITKERLKSESKNLSRATGIKLLNLYFMQLFSSSGIFLDLRSQHFEESSERLTWNPSGLWSIFSEEFRIGLLKVYEGFYLEKDHLYYQGLEEIGLLDAHFSQEDKETLGKLFRAQFGAALDQDMRFKLDHLKNSIIQMSDFMLRKKVKISKDFLYLGIYLVTLYSSLEESGEALPVKKIYLDVRQKFTV